MRHTTKLLLPVRTIRLDNDVRPDPGRGTSR